MCYVAGLHALCTRHVTVVYVSCNCYVRVMHVVGIVFVMYVSSMCGVTDVRVLRDPVCRCYVTVMYRTRYVRVIVCRRGVPCGLFG